MYGTFFLLTPWPSMRLLTMTFQGSCYEFESVKVISAVARRFKFNSQFSSSARSSFHDQQLGFQWKMIDIDDLLMDQRNVTNRSALMSVEKKEKKKRSRHLSRPF